MYNKKELKNMNFIIVPSSWVRNDFEKARNYSNYEVLIFSLLQKNMLIRDRKIIFNLQWLYEQLNINPNNDKKGVKMIKEILKQLIAEGVFTCNEDILKANKNKLITFRIKEIKRYFVKVYDYEFERIFYSDYSLKEKKNLFAVFCNIKSRIDFKKYCYPSQKQIEEDVGISTKSNSIVKYLKCLKKLELIDYDNPGLKVLSDKIGQANNIYVLCYEGYEKVLADAIEKRKEELKEFYDISVFKNKDINRKRSESMKVYWNKKFKDINKEDKNQINQNEIEQVEALFS